jgi:glycosyltransferase involved in cell wall biosynthesis
MPEDAPEIRYIASHVDGPKLVKALAAFVGTVRLLWAILFWRAGIVHVHTASRASFVRKSSLAAMARLFGRKTVVHVHGGGFEDFFDGASAATRSAISATLARADLVLALSDVWKQRLARMAPGAEIRVLRNSVATDDFAPLAATRADVPEDGGALLFLGALNRGKGVYDLIDAMEAVVRDRPGVVLELGGDQDVAEVERLVTEKGLSDNVRTLGWVRGREKLDAFARAHAYVLPSYCEGLPISLLEAMSAGLPVVTTPVGGIPEVVKHGVNGLMITPGDVRGLADSILTLLGDGALRETMGATNTELVRSRHDAGQVAGTLASWYNELLTIDRP